MAVTSLLTGLTPAGRLASVGAGRDVQRSEMLTGPLGIGRHPEPELA